VQENDLSNEAAALADILKWSADLPAWQRDALRRLCDQMSLCVLRGLLQSRWVFLNLCGCFGGQPDPRRITCPDGNAGSLMSDENQLRLGARAGPTDLGR